MDVFGAGGSDNRVVSVGDSEKLKGADVVGKDIVGAGAGGATGGKGMASL